MDETPASPRGALLAKIGACLEALYLAIGVVGVAIAFTGFGKATGPDQVSHVIGDVLTFAMVTHTQSISGLILITVAITLQRYRAEWMFYFLFFYGILMIVFSACLLLFPPLVPICMASSASFSWVSPR